jgi:hypothetical protein
MFCTGEIHPFTSPGLGFAATGGSSTSFTLANKAAAVKSRISDMVRRRFIINPL